MVTESISPSAPLGRGQKVRSWILGFFTCSFALIFIIMINSSISLGFISLYPSLDPFVNEWIYWSLWLLVLGTPLLVFLYFRRRFHYFAWGALTAFIIIGTLIMLIIGYTYCKFFCRGFIGH